LLFKNKVFTAVLIIIVFIGVVGITGSVAFGQGKNIGNEMPFQPLISGEKPVAPEKPAQKEPASPPALEKPAPQQPAAKPTEPIAQGALPQGPTPSLPPPTTGEAPAGGGGVITIPEMFRLTGTLFNGRYYVGILVRGGDSFIVRTGDKVDGYYVEYLDGNEIILRDKQGVKLPIKLQEVK